MIIDKYKAIFIHIPKNAGTSIEEYFGNESVRIQPSKHADIHEIKRKFKNSYNNYKKFTIIRNPYDKMVSWYFYLKRNLGENYNVIEFNKWIKDPSKFWHIDDPISFLKPQFDWIDETVDIIKYENLNEDLKIIQKKLNLTSKVDGGLPHLNQVTKHLKGSYKKWYTPEMVRIVNDVYEDDIKNFEFKF